MPQQSGDSGIKVSEKTIKQLDQIIAKVNKLKNKTITTTVNVKDKITKTLNEVIVKANKLKNKTITTTVNVKDRISKTLGEVILKINKLKNKTITTTVNVKGKISKTLSQVTSDIKNIKNKYKNTTSDDKDGEKKGNSKSAFGKVKGFIKDHAGDVAGFAKESISAAQAQQATELSFANTLKLKNKATKEQIDSILKLTSAQQQNGVVSDEVQMAGAQQLASYAGNTKNIKSLIPAMNNLLVAQKGLNGTSDDAVEVADLMGEGLNGQTEGLKAAGLAFSEAEGRVIRYGTKEERAAMLAKIISNNVGEANAKIAGTDVGAIQRAQNLFGDLKEQIGTMLLPYLAKFAKWFSDNQPMIKGVIDSIAKAIVTGIEKVSTFFQNIAQFISKHQDGIIFVIGFIGAIAGLIGIINLVAAVITTVITIMGILTVAQSLFNLTLLGCPIIWIIVGIGLLIAAIVGLIVYWDKIKAAAASLGKALFSKFKNIKDSVVGFFKNMASGIREHWGAIIEFLRHPIKGVTKLIQEYDESSKGTGEKGHKETKGKQGTNAEPHSGTVQKGTKAHKALGTSYWKGGLTYINERGGEIVDLPNGSRVIPADKSERMMNSGSVSIGNIYITTKGVTANEVVNEIVPKLKLALANL
ncbi:phage tail tape measure protein [Aminipila terrae]|uniref:Phage tail tape measure protein n=1 Tax=Aminipila terrae TaxID=2697030 RepID=A0A6P1MEA2_9FIRM|nr:hypothetical protein [Aminipila terrae]QHI71463.1 hypothetical protein Ami3637_02885 [Aminipila terrae]